MIAQLRRIDRFQKGEKKLFFYDLAFQRWLTRGGGPVCVS